VDTNEGQNKD
jgi:hypothetical protein